MDRPDIAVEELGHLGGRHVGIFLRIGAAAQADEGMGLAQHVELAFGHQGDVGFLVERRELADHAIVLQHDERRRAGGLRLAGEGADDLGRDVDPLDHDPLAVLQRAAAADQQPRQLVDSGIPHRRAA